MTTFDLNPLGRREQALAGRLVGVESFGISIRAEPMTRAVGVGERIGDARDGARIFNIRWIGNLDERGRFLLLPGAERGSRTNELNR